MTLYEELKAAGCALANHGSDLYVEASVTAVEIVTKHQKAGHPVRPRPFRDNVTGETWLDLPFCYDPFWLKASAEGAKLTA